MNTTTTTTRLPRAAFPHASAGQCTTNNNTNKHTNNNNFQLEKHLFDNEHVEIQLRSAPKGRDGGPPTPEERDAHKEDIATAAQQLVVAFVQTTTTTCRCEPLPPIAAIAAPARARTCLFHPANRTRSSTRQVLLGAAMPTIITTR